MRCSMFGASLAGAEGAHAASARPPYEFVEIDYYRLMKFCWHGFGLDIVDYQLLELYYWYQFA